MPIRKTSIHSQYAGAQFDNKLRNTTILYKLQELVQAILRMSRSNSGALACLKMRTLACLLFPVRACGPYFSKQYPTVWAFGVY